MEQLTIRIPPGALHVHSATCPGGCSLMDADAPIGGFPSIKVVASFGITRGLVHLDAGYGSFAHEIPFAIPPRTVVDLECPACGRSLKIPDLCLDCQAPMFRLTLPRGGAVEGCLRQGCHRHRIEVADPDRDLLQLFDQHHRIMW
ncbi:MAG TPA: hypothetical protein VGQ83_18505 [Polyangia bacterium]|jgi:hypothetical protein